MKLLILASTCFSLAIILPSPAHGGARLSGPDSQWIGVWQAKLDGQPGVDLTLGDDTGLVGGTVVFHVVSRDGGQPHVIGHDAHVLMNPRIDGDTLRFQVIRLGDNRQLEMTMRMTADGTAMFHCLNCGDDSAATEMVRAR